jgi:hypothetical protein
MKLSKNRSHFKRVRVAINLAINKEEILDFLTLTKYFVEKPSDFL